MYVKLLHLYLSISQVIRTARCFIKDPENKKHAIALNYPRLKKTTTKQQQQQNIKSLFARHKNAIEGVAINSRS